MFETMGTAKVVKSLYACWDDLQQAKDGAHMANDEPLFSRLHTKQMEIEALISELIKTKGERSAKGKG